MKCDKSMMLLYAVTDRAWTGKMSLYEQVEAALKNGATCVQLREKELEEADFLKEAIEIKKLCKEYQVPFIINDNVEIAVKCGADGIHVGQEDMLASDVRSRVGDDMMIGVSAHTVEEAIEAVKNGADYLGLGAVFNTSTKLDVDNMSAEMLRAICDSVDVPTVAIGGISGKNIMQLSGSGVDGVAVVSAIFAAEDPGKAAADLLVLAKEMVREMNKRFAIFDMDGTLIDSMKVWSNLGREYLRAKGVQEGIASVMEEVESLTMSESAELFVERFSLPGNAESVLHEMNCIMDEHYKNDIPLKKGVKEYLETLKASGVRMCVASATAEYLMEACLERLGISTYFDFILSCESMSTSKREPEIYLKAAGRFGAVPEDTAVYEDALYAVETAGKAGFYVVGVYDAENAGQWEQICSVADEVIDLN